MKKNIISISGEPASGKGAVSSILQSKLNYGIYRNGEYFRTLAQKYGMDVTSFGKYVEKHPEIDRDIETRAREYAKDHDNFIIDARLGWYAVPFSFKVYLTVDIDEAAKRAFNDVNRKNSENLHSLEEQKKDMVERYNLENKRYLKLYNVDKTNLNNYDLVIDTTSKKAEEVAKIIIDEYQKWLNK